MHVRLPNDEISTAESFKVYHLATRLPVRPRTATWRADHTSVSQRDCPGRDGPRLSTAVYPIQGQFKPITIQTGVINGGSFVLLPEVLMSALNFASQICARDIAIVFL